MNLRRIASLLAWLLFGVIAYSTLSPIGMRPHIGTWVHVERFGAFGLLGLLFMIAYPGRLWFVIAIVLGTAVGFELLQMLSMDRHARWEDLAVKLAGGGCGIVAACFIARRLPRINQNSNYPG
ncbi:MULTISPECIES: VanZ family protein [unclassified Sinorhizobium]|uniref:VanZ family protein n=1 Tax=unclassified Sinorhizobium TaxID=2613772 RepID=UPI0024C43929|nr:MULTISPECIES: VanZ family protein [unclassified Sinorhizobium]MDK1377416.1 VanZ family protein [Sinorhizobium sp. 6-70]MDK1477657.1 VanZ family protein [Sinorhizobium sp. 6-117]